MYRQRNLSACELKELSNDNEEGKKPHSDTASTCDGTAVRYEGVSQNVVIAIPQEVGENATEDMKAYANQSFVGEMEDTQYNDLPSPESSQVDILSNQSKSPNHSEEMGFLEILKKKLWHLYKIHSKTLKILLKMLFFVLYNVYLGYAIYLTWNEVSSYCHGVKLLSLVTIVVYFCVLFKTIIKPFCLKPLLKKLSPVCTYVASFKHLSKVSWSLIWLAVVIFLIMDSQDNRYRLVSAAGLVGLIFAGFIFSAYPKKIIWRHVQWGVFLQFILSLIILRWNVGREFFDCLGKKIKSLLEFTDVGSGFVFGILVSGKLENIPTTFHIFAFKVLPVVIFFSFMVSILYYYGWMQIAVINVGWLLQKTVGTTACESMNAAANIFLGMSETPIMIRPYLQIMTKSELHAVLTGGFATIAGSVMSAYIFFGISPSHLLSASVMSAPAALAFSKLVYPETEESVTRIDNIVIEKGKERNAIEAASNGASAAVTLVAYIVANLIAFVAFIAFVDGILTWLGSLVHWDFVSFEWLMSKLFMPLSLMMGVEWKDSEKVAQLVGLKTVVNEFVAYERLAAFKKEHLISARSQAIATFALCGFSNIGSIGIQLGTLGALAPERKPDIANLVVRAMIAGSAACFMTACVAGTLLTEYD